VNLKIDVQRVGLNLHKSGLGAAYGARVCWLEHEQLILKTHVLSLRPTLVRCGVRTLKKSFLKVELKARALCAGVSIVLILRNYPREKLYKIAHSAKLSTDFFGKSRMACLWVATIYDQIIQDDQFFPDRLFTTPSTIRSTILSMVLYWLRVHPRT
jgi:hypothetical protein